LYWVPRAVRTRCCSRRRAGPEAAAGDRCLQRAEALQAAGRPLHALREFRQAKINWFRGDTLYGTLRAMACITGIYAGLGMYLAGKKYALGRVGETGRSRRPGPPQVGARPG
jgi:hypothetical protein